MFDKEIVLDSLQKIKASLELIVERASVVSDHNDFLCSPGATQYLLTYWKLRVCVILPICLADKFLKH